MIPSYLSNIIEWPAGHYIDWGFSKPYPRVLAEILHWPELYVSHATLSRN